MPKTRAQVHQEMMGLIMDYLFCLQGGGWGPPSIEDLQFAGLLHRVIEESAKLIFLDESVH